MKTQSVHKIQLLRQNARSVVRELGLLNDAYFDIGVTLAERHLLLELAGVQETLTASCIAERLLLDKSTVSRLVARAEKKGFIKSVMDREDKRKRFLHLTDLGTNTLHIFEPIAFRQTEKALQTLTKEEAELVYRGVALYAQGLKNSRLNHLVPKEPKNERESLDDILEQLQQKGCTLELFQKGDEKELYAIFKEVVDSGSQFPYESSSQEEFQAQFFGSSTQAYVCRASNGAVIGGFYLKPNYSGRSRHIANAAYMMKSTHRGQGFGSLLIKASLHFAKSLGFLAMQYNMVLSRNTGAVKLYERLGFEILGTIPNAVRNPDGSFQDGYTLYRPLNKI